MECPLQEDRVVLNREKVQKDSADRKSDHGTVDRTVQQNDVEFPGTDKYDAQKDHRIPLQIQSGAPGHFPDEIAGDGQQKNRGKCKVNIMTRTGLQNIVDLP